MESLTNPCFEFWLLLHFDKVFELEQNKLLENPKVTAKRRYVEQELRKILPGYGKGSYRAMEVIKHIDKAIENEKKFCEDVVMLKDKVGSNLGCLIEELKKCKGDIQHGTKEIFSIQYGALVLRILSNWHIDLPDCSSAALSSIAVATATTHSSVLHLKQSFFLNVLET